MNEDITIDFLADNLQVIPMLEESYQSEWNDYYGPGDARSEIHYFEKL